MSFFGRCFERFVKAFGYVLELNGNIMGQRAALYENEFNAAVTPIPGCVGFNDYTKIRIKGPGGEGTLQ